MTDDVSREDVARFTALRQTKTEGLVEIITLLVNQAPGGNSQEMENIADHLAVELLNPPHGMARGALHHATLDVILHLLRRLAEARGEPVAQAWQQEAAELTRGAERHG